ncbi:unnamed protein product, partial [Polarella glacialis]
AGGTTSPSLPIGGPEQEPHLLVAGRGLCVLWKPAGWASTFGGSSEDDSQEKLEAHSVGPGQRNLSQQDLTRSKSKSKDWATSLPSWIQEKFSNRPLAFDVQEQFGLVHRLDLQTSGPLLLALDYRTFYAAQLEFVARRVQKYYTCLCHGFVERRGRWRTLNEPLRVERSGGGPPRSVVSAGGRAARTDIFPAAHLSDTGDGSSHFSLLQVQLHTGRMHQIRAHLASI